MAWTFQELLESVANGFDRLGDEQITGNEAADFVRGIAHQIRTKEIIKENKE